MSSVDIRNGNEFYSKISLEYDDLMDQHPGNGWVRTAFRQMVREAIPTGAFLLDFGCGTGLDTLWYAQHGYRVLAYDVSSGMMEQVHRRCAQEVAAGQVVPLYGDYAEFPTLVQRHAGLQAVVANFAVLNHIDDLQTLFTVLAGQLPASGQVIVSVVNPFFWKDIRQRMWWKPCLRSFKTRRVIWAGDVITQYRHYISRVVGAASPHFVEVEQAGVATFLSYEDSEQRYLWDAPRSLSERLETHFWRSFPLRHVGKFIFLHFRRVGAGA